jgi:hypothetical protein
VTEREIPLNRETDNLIRLANRFDGVPEWEKLFGSRKFTVHLALESAAKIGIEPDPAYEPDWEKVDGKYRPVYPLRINLDGTFDDKENREIASVVLKSLRHYFTGGNPVDAPSSWSFEPNVRLPDGCLRELALGAMLHRVTWREYTGRYARLGMERILRNRWHQEERKRTVRIPVEPEKYSSYSIEVVKMGGDPDWMLAFEIVKMLNEGVSP